MVLIAVALLTGCSGSTKDQGIAGNSGSCVLRARLDGRWYFATGGFRVIPEYGEPLGTATVPPCGDEDGYSIEAVAIVGLSPEVGFASPSYEDAVFLAEGTDPLPPELVRLRHEPTCGQRDAPIQLHGPWLGIIGADGETEVDLVPPYDLSMRVDDASDARYERAFLTIRVGSDMGRPLSREDVRSSLWEGGDLSVTATCRDGRFLAEQVTASPPR
jgi:hypothetical protein